MSDGGGLHSSSLFADIHLLVCPMSVFFGFRKDYSIVLIYKKMGLGLISVGSPGIFWAIIGVVKLFILCGSCTHFLTCFYVDEFLFFPFGIDQSMT